jgi:hypothetical protein
MRLTVGAIDLLDFAQGSLLIAPRRAPTLATHHVSVANQNLGSLSQRLFAKKIHWDDLQPRSEGRVLN